MNPYPFVGLNHFTVPVAICVSNVGGATIGGLPRRDKGRDRPRFRADGRTICFSFIGLVEAGSGALTAKATSASARRQENRKLFSRQALWLLTADAGLPRARNGRHPHAPGSASADPYRACSRRFRLPAFDRGWPDA